MNQRIVISARVRKQQFKSQSIYDCYEQDEYDAIFDSCLNKRLFSMSEMDDEFEKKICYNQLQEYTQLQQYPLPQPQNIVQIQILNLKKDDSEIELISFAKQANQNDIVNLDDFKLLSIDEVNYIQCLEGSEQKVKRYVQKKKQNISKKIHKLKF